MRALVIGNKRLSLAYMLNPIFVDISLIFLPVRELGLGVFDPRMFDGLSSLGRSVSAFEYSPLSIGIFVFI